MTISRVSTALFTHCLVNFANRLALQKGEVRQGFDIVSDRQIVEGWHQDMDEVRMLATTKIGKVAEYYTKSV